MLKPHRLLLSVIVLLGGTLSLSAQFVWSGRGISSAITNPGNWQGGTAPLSGSADLYLGKAINQTLIFSAPLTLHSISISGGDEYKIKGSAPTTLTLTNGLTAGDNNFSSLVFNSNLTLNLAGAQTLDAWAGQIRVSGQITGSSPVTLQSSSATGGGFFIFNNTGAGHTYTGGTTLGDGTHSIGVAFWNSAPFGTGAVNVLTNPMANVELIAHGTQTVTNAFTVSGGGPMTFKSWDAPLTFSGAITLASNTIFGALVNQPALAAPNQAGSIPIPGAVVRQPIVFSGAIGESGGSRSLTVTYSGILMLTGTNTYTGGTTVNGTGVFGNASSAGSGPIFASPSGYVGFADTFSGNFASFLGAHFNTGSTGAIGIDTLPGNSTVIFTDAITLTGYNPSLRLGTATSAILTGTITPQATSNYQFGNGGGTLYVQSNLSTPGKGLSLQSNNVSFPLTVYLQGTNAYTSATNVANGLLIFDGANALPATTLTASGSSTAVGGSYIGYTNVVGITPATFLSKFNQASTWGIIGFDTHQSNPTVSLSGVNLAGFNDGVFLGTSTSAIIDASTVTHTSVPNGNAPNTLRFTAAQSGVLTVNGNIGGAVAVMLGTPAFTGAYSSGTVIMNGSNTYTGGTTLNASTTFAGLTLALGNSSALGSGPLTVTSTNGGGIAGIQATSGGINLPNAIALATGGNSPGLYFTGTNAFTLSGNITGDANSALHLYNASPLTVSLAGDNSGFLGYFGVYNGLLNALTNTALGSGNLDFGQASTGTVTFGGSATAPVLYGIKGDSGSLILPSGTTLTVDVSDDSNHDGEFGGIISGAGSLIVSAPSASSPKGLFLYGANTYSGGTQILNRGVLALSNNTAAGTGTVTLNAPNGGLGLNSGVTFTNQLVFTAGTLGGFGTFAPTGTSTLTFDTGRNISPGLGGLSQGHDGGVGTLTLNTNAIFANGGGYLWGLQDATTLDGISRLDVTGNLNITASAGGFLLTVNTYDANRDLGFANLSYGTPYSLLIIHVGGTLTGFSPSAFTIDATQFQNGSLSSTVFTLSQSGSDIYLNFTPVPEPSTYALLGLGLGAVFLPALRRRRLVKS
jgi:hypothetical protein